LILPALLAIPLGHIGLRKVRKSRGTLKGRGRAIFSLLVGYAVLIYLVGFSYAFFFQGFTGLAITIGAIVTLFVVMQMTARIDWNRRTAAAVGQL